MALSGDILLKDYWLSTNIIYQDGPTGRRYLTVTHWSEDRIVIRGRITTPTTVTGVVVVGFRAVPRTSTRLWFTSKGSCWLVRNEGPFSEGHHVWCGRGWGGRACNIDSYDPGTEGEEE